MLVQHVLALFIGLKLFSRLSRFLRGGLVLFGFVIGRDDHVYRFSASVEEIILWNLAIATPEVMNLRGIFWLVLDYWHRLRLL